MRKSAILIVPITLLLTGLTACQSTSSRNAPGGGSSEIKSVGESAGRIATQPAKDVGVAKTSIPPALAEAVSDPYSMKGLATCRQIAVAFHRLSEELGPDFEAGDGKKENRAGKIAEAGGKTVVNSLIPFRGLVREMTGAAPAQRRLNNAIDAGYARRGFLRGLYTARKCRSPALS